MKKGEKLTQGFIVASKNDLNLSGKGDIVYIDLGREDNLSPGHTLSIFTMPRKVFDPDNKDELTIPGARIGKVVLLNVQEQVSTGIILKSSRQVEPGNIVVLDM